MNKNDIMIFDTIGKERVRVSADTTKLNLCREILPPESFEFAKNGNVPIVFTAGSIDMGSKDVPDWQKDLVESLSDVECIVLNPRRKAWDSSWVQSIENEHFRGQVEWELEGLDQADLIALYLTEKSKAPISLLELGLHAAGKKMIVCCPDGFWRKGNVEIVCARYGIQLLNDYKDFKNEVHRFMLNAVRTAPIKLSADMGGLLRGGPDYGEKEMDMEKRMENIASMVANKITRKVVGSNKEAKDILHVAKDLLASIEDYGGLRKAPDSGMSGVKVSNLFRGTVIETINVKNIRINGELRGSSGFLKNTKTGKYAYFNTESSSYGPISGKILMRTAKGERDFSGGINNFVAPAEMVETALMLTR